MHFFVLIFRGGLSFRSHRCVLLTLLFSFSAPVHLFLCTRPRPVKLPSVFLHGLVLIIDFCLNRFVQQNFQRSQRWRYRSRPRIALYVFGGRDFVAYTGGVVFGRVVAGFTSSITWFTEEVHLRSIQALRTVTLVVCWCIAASASASAAFMS